MYNLLLEKYYQFLANKKKAYIQKLVNKGLHLGTNVSIVDTFFFDPSHCFLISIGDNCIFAPGVRLIAHDASTKLFLGYTKIGKINIGDNCFIGDSVIVLPCVTIGPGCIVGAGSVVTKDVPPGVLVAGNPAKVICSVDEYIKKIKDRSLGKQIFNENYLINNLNKKRREEILSAVENSIGFIV